MATPSREQTRCRNTKRSLDIDKTKVGMKHRSMLGGEREDSYFIPFNKPIQMKNVAQRSKAQAPFTRSRFHGETAKVLYGSAFRPHEAAGGSLYAHARLFLFNFLLDFCSRSSAPYGPGMCTTAFLQIYPVSLDFVFTEILRNRIDRNRNGFARFGFVWTGPKSCHAKPWRVVLVKRKKGQ